MEEEPTIHIDLLEPADWARSRDIRLRSLASDPDAFGSTLEQELERPESFWRGRLERAMATIVAVVGGEDVGICVIAPIQESERSAGIFGVWVDPEERGAGLGEALLQAAEKLARQEGLTRLVLDVGDANEPAVRLYERMGYRRTGRTSCLEPPREHITEHERVRVLEPTE